MKIFWRRKIICLKYKTFFVLLLFARLCLANPMNLAIAEISGKAQSLDITKGNEENISQQVQKLVPDNAFEIESELKQLEQNYYAQIDTGTLGQEHDSMQAKMLQNNALSNSNANVANLKELTDKTSINRKKITINQNNELLQIANSIQKTTKVDVNGDVSPPKANNPTKFANKIFTCRESANPIIRKCYKNRVVKVIKPADFKFILTVYFSAQSFDGHSTVVDLKDGTINYANATAINLASHVVNPLKQKLIGSQIVSVRHIESRWWDEAGVHTGSVTHTITQLPNRENNFVYKNTIVQEGIHGRASKRRNSNKYRGRVEKWEITATPDAVLEDTWDNGQCQQLEQFASKNHCNGPIINLIDLNKTKAIANYSYPVTRAHWQEEYIYTCGADNKIDECKSLHQAFCTQVDSKCIKMRGEFCAEYLQTFNCSNSQLNIMPGNNGVAINAVENRGIDDTFAIDDFGSAVSQLSIIDEMKKNIMRPTDGIVLLFKGERLTCDKDWGSDIKNCCNLKGVFKNIIGHKCPEHIEKTLAPAVVRERRCVKILGWQCIAKTLGKCRKWQKSYCCYQSRLARIFQQIAHHQLGLSWGTADAPNCEPLDPHTFGRLNFDEPYAKSLLKELVTEANGNAQNYANKANSKLTNVDNLTNKVTDLQEKVNSYYANKMQKTDRRQ